MTDDEFSRWIASATKAKANDAYAAAALCADAIRLLTEGVKTNGRAEPETEVASVLRDILRLPVGDHEGAMEAWSTIHVNAAEAHDEAAKLALEEEPKLPHDTRDWRDV